MTGKSLGIDLLTKYEENKRELAFHAARIKQYEEDSENLFSRSSLELLKPKNRNPLGSSDAQIKLLDDLHDMRKTLGRIKDEQKEIMCFVDDFLPRDSALVIRAYHELEHTYAEIGMLYYISESTARRQYRKGIEELDQVLETKTPYAMGL